MQRRLRAIYGVGHFQSDASFENARPTTFKAWMLCKVPH
jgi:hypothetical protein